MDQGNTQIYFTRKGNKPNFGKSKWGSLETPLSVSKHWPYTFVIVRQQSQCFDALLIFKRILMSENWFKQDVQILQFMHRIGGTFCVRRYQQFCTLMMNGNADNQNLLIAVAHCVERTDFDQVGSLVLFNWNMPKSTTGFSHAPLETAFTLHRGTTACPPRLFQLPVIIASNFTCSKVILSSDFYCGNAVDPPAWVKPPWDTKNLILPTRIHSPPARDWGVRGFWKTTRAVL